MIDILNKEEKEKLYEFRGKQFYCKPSIVKHLNFALALNRSHERYEEIESTATTKGRNSKGSDS